MRILLVDDDVQFIRYLQGAVDYEKLGISEVFVAYNKNMAISVIQQQSPQIVITDIEMPMGNGIELVRWIREQNYACEVIVLTNYERFEIARSAINLGVAGYLTKPVVEAELKDAIVQAAERHENTIPYTWLGNRQVRRYPFSQEKQLLDMLFSSSNCIVRFPFVLLCVCIYTSSFELIRYKNIYDLRVDIASCFDDVLPTELAETRENHRLMFWLTLSLNAWSCQQCAELKKELQRLSDTHSFRVTCFVETIYYPETLKSIGEKIETLAGNTLSEEIIIELRDDSVQVRKGTDHLKVSKKCYQLYTEDNYKAIILLFSHTLTMLQSENQLDKTVLNQLRDEFLQATYAFLYDAGHQSHTIWKSADEKKLLDDSDKSVFDLLHMIDFVSRSTLSVVKHGQECGSDVVKAIAYIKENYAHPISRSDIAEHVGFSADHFAKLFKSKTGQSLNEYLTDYRIKRAKVLLCTTEMSISKIAIAVGYDNLPYFSTIFKRYTQMTPEQYRKAKATIDKQHTEETS